VRTAAPTVQPSGRAGNPAGIERYLASKFGDLYRRGVPVSTSGSGPRWRAGGGGAGSREGGAGAIAALPAVEWWRTREEAREGYRVRLAALRAQR
jgi:hypothetical protein